MHITSNHKKLVNACYPTEETQTESKSKPNSNSLSKLIYYCQTKPHKIKKVTNYLISYAQSQSKPSSLKNSLSPYRHSKSGLLCTLEIFNSILLSSHHHLDEFFIDLLYLIHIGLGLIPIHQDHSNQSIQNQFIGFGWVGEDLDLSIKSIELFTNSCQFLNSKTFLDHQFFNSHLILIDQFTSISMVKTLNSNNFAKTLAILALGDLILSEGFYSSTEFSSQVKLIIPGIMSTFLPNQNEKPDESISTIIKELTDESRRLIEFEELEIKIKIMKENLLQKMNQVNSKSIPTLDLTIYSIQIFHFLLNTHFTNLIQFEIILSLIFSNLETSFNLNSLNFLNSYLLIYKMILSWSRLKYRSIVIDLLVNRIKLLDHQSLEEKDSKKDLLNSKIKLLGTVLQNVLEDELIQTIEVLNVMKILNELIKLLSRNPKSEILIECIASVCLNPFDNQQIDEVFQLILERVMEETDSIHQDFIQSLLKSLNLILLKSNRLPSYQTWIPALLSTSSNLKETDLFDKALSTYIKLFDFSFKSDEDYKSFISSINVFVYRTDHHQSILELLSKKNLMIYSICLPMLMQLDLNTTLVSKTFEFFGLTDEVKEWDLIIQSVLKDLSMNLIDEELNEERFKDEIYKRIWTIDYGLRIAGIEMINKRNIQKPISIKRISSIRSYNTTKSLTPSKRLLYLNTKYSNYPSIVELRESLLPKHPSPIMNRSMDSCESFGDVNKSSIVSKKSLRLQRSSKVLEAIDSLESRGPSRLGFGEGSGTNGKTNGDSTHQIRLLVSPPYGP